MRYILAYFALMLGLSGLSLLWAGHAYGFLLLLIAALIYVLVRTERARRRERRYGGYGEAIEGYEKRFTGAARELESKLPKNALEDPLDQIARAALKLEQAKATCTHRFAGKLPAELTSQLVTGDEKLGQARAAIAKGAERPLDATRLSQEVCALAACVEATAGKLVEAPAAIETDCARLELDFSGVKAKLEAAAESYSPSCLVEIKGCADEAEESMKRVRALLAGGSESTGDVSLEEAGEAVSRAQVLVKRIEDHVASLEQASLNGRRAVEEAELEIDQAWASVTASSDSAAETERAERVATRARELAAQARAELQQAKPDWFRVTALAERAVHMAHELGSVSRSRRPPAGSARPDVEAARARAEATLAEVRPIVAEADGLRGEDNMARVCLEHAQQAYNDSVAAQTRLVGADDPDAAARTAIDGFRLAEESAGVAREHAVALRERASTRPPGKAAARSLWGALGRPFASE